MGRITVTVGQETKAVDYTIAPPVAVPLIGCDWSTANPPEPTYFNDWPVRRIYRFSHAANAAATGVQRVCVTDDPATPANGGAAAAQTLRNALEAFYYGSGSTARKDVLYDWALRNEEDREFTSGTLPQAVVDTHRLCYDVIHEKNPDGSRRYPNASAWIDMTVWQVQTKDAGNRFAPVAPFLDGFACSLYNPGREVPTTFTPYANYVDEMLDTAVSWGLDRFAIWETGTPIDKSFPSGAPNNGGTTDWTKRPAYMTGQLDYTLAGCQSRGLAFEVALYWNRQDDPDIPNQWKHDRGQAPNDTATAWHNWTP